MKRSLACLLTLLTICSLAAGQVVVNPYYNPYYGRGYGAGNYLSGAADYNRSYSDVAVQFEKAKQLNEQTKQMKLDTKRKAFDEMMYEKANTPSYLETLTQDKMMYLQRVMSYPTKGEIANGTTLNTMMPLLQSLLEVGTPGPPIRLVKPALADLNVSINGTSSVGLFRNGGKIFWPIGLRGPQQKKLDKLFPEAYKAVLDGSLDDKLMMPIRSEMKSMRLDLRDRMLKEQVAPSAYMQGIDFYNFLELSVNALERPDARKQLDGTYAALGNNVQELVDYMTAAGLKFSPAVPGSENSYQSVHDAFVRYARTAQAAAGDQIALKKK
jgi:hypothetical protein